ncbi:hypothetical protein V5N11_030335 [Cardamine amara subsp. amara]|uniref:Arabidopsis retrotransposon Orf1 C-terminal domain-containing protein n=1 Tax=Cardamine amara subsp. amara TaxID=228776 RepID=A0ABD1AVE3_CARAN
MFYNAWLGVDIQPTRLADSCAVRRMGIKDDVTKLIMKIGLGTIATTRYDLFPDLVRQFLATVRVYYENETVKTVQEGTLTFLIRGVRYRLPLRDLYELYGFDPDLTGVALPAQFLDANVIWSYFGTGRYDSKTSTQTDIRHPVLRYVAQFIGEMEPGKMRMSEMILLYYAIGDLCEDGCEWPELDRNINLGAIFAHHLVSLKTKTFLGRGTKRESVGSLLTPIFCDGYVLSKECALDQERVDLVFQDSCRVSHDSATTAGAYSDYRGPEPAAFRAGFPPPPHGTTSSTPQGSFFFRTSYYCGGCPDTRPCWRSASAVRSLRDSSVRASSCSGNTHGDCCHSEVCSG